MAVVDFFWWDGWMLEGCGGKGERRGAVLEKGRDGVLVAVFHGRVWRRDDFWLLVLLLLLRVGIVRIIILMYSYYQSA